MRRHSTLSSVLVFILLAVASCVPSYRTIIPEGLYQTDEGVEQIYVDSETMYVITRVTGMEQRRPDAFLVRNTLYSVTEEGEILLVDERLYFESEWRWIDGKIARIESSGVRWFEWDLVDGEIVPIERRSEPKTTWFIRHEEESTKAPQDRLPDKEATR